MNKGLFKFNYEVKCICHNDSILSISEIIKCESCQLYQHKKCVDQGILMENYECASCQVQKMDFKVKIILQKLLPSLIQNNNKIFTKNYSFSISRDQHTIYSKLNDVYFFIRCIRLDRTGYELR